MTTTESTAAPLACAFGGAILARQGACPLATMALLGEAERPRCSSPVANTNCRTFRALVRERATFALRLPPPATLLTHAAEIRIECGGLRGLAEALGDPPGPPADVHALVNRARDAYDGLLGIPFATVVAAVTGWEGRPRSAGGSGAP